MSQHSDLNKIERSWLNDARKQSSERVLSLGIKSIDELVKKNERVTYSNIVKKSKELDSDGKGIHQNTIRSNYSLYEYYKNHSSSYKISNKRKVVKEINTIDTSRLWSIKLERDINTVRKRYKNLSKDELIDQLVMTEQFIAEELKSFLSKQFKSFPKD